MKYNLNPLHSILEEGTQLKQNMSQIINRSPDTASKLIEKGILKKGSAIRNSVAKRTKDYLNNDDGYKKSRLFTAIGDKSNAKQAFKDSLPLKYGRKAAMGYALGDALRNS